MDSARTSPIDRERLITGKVSSILNWRQQSEQDPISAYMADLAPLSRRTMRWALDAVAKWASGGAEDASTFQWHLLRAEHTDAIRTWLARSALAPASANLVLSALRQVMRRCRRRHLIGIVEYEDAVDMAVIKGWPVTVGHALSKSELAILFRVCDVGTARGARDAAIFSLGFGAGLRRAEIVGLDVNDLNVRLGSLRVQKGKGGFMRDLPLPEGTTAALTAWLKKRGDSPGPLFLPVDQHGIVVRGSRLSGQTIYDVCRRRATEAGIPVFTPHDMRRTYIGFLLDAGVDISVVQRLAGHRDVRTTSAYDRRPEFAKQKAAQLLDIPYVQVDGF